MKRFWFWPFTDWFKRNDMDNLFRWKVFKRTAFDDSVMFNYVRIRLMFSIRLILLMIFFSILWFPYHMYMYCASGLTYFPSLLLSYVWKLIELLYKNRKRCTQRVDRNLFSHSTINATLCYHKNNVNNVFINSIPSSLKDCNSMLIVTLGN